MADPYILPNGTLKNKLGLTDAKTLDAVEGPLVSAREANVRQASFPSPLGIGNIRDIHREIFQDVYDWAGEYRTINLHKKIDLADAKVSTFASYDNLTERLSRIDAWLADKNHLCGLSRDAFAVGAARLFIDLNSAHPFREGNGRTQRLFVERIARAAGHACDFKVVTKERMIAVSIAGHHGDTEAVVRLFDEITDATRVRALKRALDYLRKSSVAWNDLYIATTVTGQVYHGTLVARDPGASGDFLLRVDDPETRLFIGASDDLDDETEPGDDTELTVSRFGPA